MHQRNKAFTLIEMLVVISIIGVLAGLTVGISKLASDKMRRSRVKAELNALTMAIDAYKAKFGVYPPDNKRTANLILYETKNGQNFTQVVLNTNAAPQLFYELTGCLLTNLTFQDLMFSSRLASADVALQFQVKGFVNASRSLGETKNFLQSLKPNQVAVFYRDQSTNNPVYFLKVPVKGTKAPSKPTQNTWCYNSRNPVNNPGQYDLWTEIVIGDKTLIFGNWNSGN